MGTAVVTGASSGLGRELARTARRARRARGRGRAGARRARRTLAGVLPADRVRSPPTSRRRGRDELAEAVDVVDILVNNAGFGVVGPLRGHARSGGERPDGRGQRRRADGPHRALAARHGRPGRGADPERRVDRGVPAGSDDGRVLRDQGLRAVVHRGDRRGAARHRRHRDGVLPGCVRERLPVGRRDRVVPAREGPTPPVVRRDGARRARRDGPRHRRRGARHVQQGGALVAPRFAPRPLVRRMVRWVQSDL